MIRVVHYPYLSFNLLLFGTKNFLPSIMNLILSIGELTFIWLEYQSITPILPNKYGSVPTIVCYPVINMLISKQFLGFCYENYPYFSFPPHSISACFWEIKYQSVKVSVIYFLPLRNIPYFYNHNLFLATVPVLGFLVFSRGYKMGY